MTVCVHCGRAFKRRRKTAIYCSSQCREKFNISRAAKRKRKHVPQIPVYRVTSRSSSKKKGTGRGQEELVAFQTGVPDPD